MRWRRMIAAALAVMLMVQLCPIPTAWAQNTEPYLRVDAGLGTGLVATMTGGRGMDVNISSNTRWEIQVAQGADWIGLSLTGGSGNGTFYTVIAENTTGQPREGQICIQAEGCEPIWIKVYQGETGAQLNLAGKFDLNRFAVNNDFAVYCTPDGKVEATVDEYVAQRREEYAAFKGMYGLTCTEEEYVNEYEEISLHEDYSRIRQLNDVIGVSTNSYGSSDYALLRANGTVELNHGAQSLMEYYLGYETTEYRNWRNIKQVDFGHGILLGLREDGRVESICWDMIFDTPRTQPIGTHPSQWQDVVQIAVDDACFGLKRDGTVYYYGQGIGDQLYFAGNFYDISQVSQWTDIVQISTYWGHVVGLKSDGTVVAAGENHYGVCNVSHVRNAVQVDTSYTMTACLLEDGTVELIGEKVPDPMGWRLPDVSQLKDVCAVYVTEFYLIAVMQDGSVQAVGNFPAENYLNDGTSGDCRPAMYATEKWNMASYVGNGAQQAAEPAGQTGGLPQTPVVTGVSAAQIKQNETVTFTVRGTPADWVFVYIDGKKRTNEGFSIGADGTAQFTRTVSSAGRHTFQFSAYANDAESELSDAVVIDVESVEIAVPEQTPAQQEQTVQWGSGTYRIYIDNEYFKDQGAPNSSYLTLRKGQKFRVVVKNADNYGIIDPLEKGFEIKIVDDSGYTLRIRNDGQIEAMNSGKATVALYYNGKPIDETVVYVSEVQPAEHWYTNVKCGIGLMRLDQAEKLDWSHGLAWTPNVNIFNFKSKWREDDKKNFPEGYFDVSFDVYSTSAVSYGVAAYDLYGNVVGPKVIIQPEMNTWNIVEEFVDWGEATLGMFNGKLIYGENEFYRTKTTVSLKVPDGGYIGFLQLVNDEDVKLANYAEAVLGLYALIESTLGLKKSVEDPIKNIDTMTLGGELKKVGISYDMDKIIKKGVSPDEISDAIVQLVCKEKPMDVEQAIVNSIPKNALQGAVNEAEDRLLAVFLNPGYQIKQVVNIFGKSLAELGIYNALTATEPTPTAINYIFFPYMSFEDDSPGWTEEVLPIDAKNGCSHAHYTTRWVDGQSKMLSMADNGDGATHTHIYTAQAVCSDCREVLGMIEEKTTAEGRLAKGKQVYEHNAKSHWTVTASTCPCGYTVELERSEPVAHAFTESQTRSVTQYPQSNDMHTSHHSITEVTTQKCSVCQYEVTKESTTGNMEEHTYVNDVCTQCSYSMAKELHDVLASIPSGSNPMDNPIICDILWTELADAGMSRTMIENVEKALHDMPDKYKTYREIYLYSLLCYNKNVSDQTDAYYAQLGYDDDRNIVVVNTLNLKEKANPTDNLTIWFHESGHAIDYNYAYDEDMVTWYWRKKDKSLVYFDKMKDDVRTFIIAQATSSHHPILARKWNALTQQEQELIIRSIIGSEAGYPERYDDKNRKWVITPVSLSDKLQSIRDEIVGNMTAASYGGTYATRNAYMVTDCLEGMTNGLVSKVQNRSSMDYLDANYSNFFYYSSAHMADNKDYWFSDDGQPTLAQCAEAWAEYYSAIMTNNTDAINSNLYSFPSTCEYFDKVLAVEMLEHYKKMALAK